MPLSNFRPRVVSILMSKMMQVCIFLKFRWQVLSDKVVTGSYIGDGSGSRQIDIDAEFEPGTVVIKVSEGGYVFHGQHTDEDEQSVVITEAKDDG